MAYSKDYREAAIAFKESGRTFRELNEVFKITPRTYYQWVEQKGKRSDDKVKQTRKRKIDSDKLKKAVEEKPDAYLRELSKMFDCSTTAVHKRLVSLGITYKKRHSHTRKKPRKPERNIARH